jgi:hypothetical protein
MKKAGTLLIVVLLFGFLTEGSAQALKSGFSIKGQLGFPSTEFGWTEDVNIDSDQLDEYAYGVTYGLQIGNQWYLYKQESFGIALLVNWFDVTVGTKTVEINQQKLQRLTLDIAVLEFGPLFTYAISDAMAIDAYYNLRPTAMSTGYKFNEEDSEAFAGFGVTHGFGAGFRYSLLYVGAEYVVGKVNVSQDSTDPKIWEDEKMVADCFRIIVGIKI